MARPIVFLSDYGLEDQFVGVCHGVISRIAPEAPVIDLTHGVPGHDVMRGAVLLAQSVPFMPEGAVYLAIVDPGVGSARRPVVVAARGGALLVGPDNGILSMAWEELGGAERAVEIASPEVVSKDVSATFHGRDLFAPTAGRLAAGLSLERVGPSVEIERLTRLRVREPELEEGRVRGEVLTVDRFGNLQLSLRPSHLQAAAEGEVWRLHASGGVHPLRRVRTFAELGEGELGVLVDSWGFLAIVMNRHSAAEALGTGPGEEVVLSPLPAPALGTG